MAAAHEISFLQATWSGSYRYCDGDFQLTAIQLSVTDFAKDYLAYVNREMPSAERQPLKFRDIKHQEANAGIFLQEITCPSIAQLKIHCKFEHFASDESREEYCVLSVALRPGQTYTLQMNKDESDRCQAQIREDVQGEEEDLLGVVVTGGEEYVIPAVSIEDPEEKEKPLVSEKKGMPVAEVSQVPDALSPDARLASLDGHEIRGFADLLNVGATLLQVEADSRGTTPIGVVREETARLVREKTEKAKAAVDDFMNSSETQESLAIAKAQADALLE